MKLLPLSRQPKSSTWILGIREIILKLKDDTLSTLEKHTALAAILDYMEYDKEKDEYSFYYKFEE